MADRQTEGRRAERDGGRGGARERERDRDTDAGRDTGETRIHTGILGTGVKGMLSSSSSCGTGESM